MDQHKNDLLKMCDDAEKQGLWIHIHYQDLWYSPKEMRKEFNDGKFLWNRTSFELRDPQEHLVILERLLTAAKNSVDSFKARMKA